ncbi:DUF4163 domain-containing protein [Capnocytophaga canimorsus]|nr:DUF3298 and DUF4163 domain-containing protein [Capnocytophaga canimorsus]WGU69898.1 DUF4163 domain-containing protein [Capnocytophaga canimorsus]
MKKITLLFGAFLLFSCSDKISFTEKIVQKSASDCENCGTVYLTYLQCEKPSEFAENFNKTIQNRIVDFVEMDSKEKPSEISGEVAIAQSLDNFMKEYADLQQHFPEIAAYELILTDSIVYQNKKMVSLVSKTYSFLGGAHGYETTTYLNFDAKNGKVIHNDSLFSDVEKVKEIAEKQFKSEFEIDDKTALSQNGFWFDDNTFHLPQNIGISDKSLILHYNPYEIASYADGAVVIEIPMQQIKPFFRY